jgi:hypothetical protein
MSNDKTPKEMIDIKSEKLNLCLRKIHFTAKSKRETNDQFTIFFWREASWFISTFS